MAGFQDWWADVATSSCWKQVSELPSEWWPSNLLEMRCRWRRLSPRDLLARVKIGHLWAGREVLEAWNHGDFSVYGITSVLEIIPVTGKMKRSKLPNATLFHEKLNGALQNQGQLGLLQSSGSDKFCFLNMLPKKEGEKASSLIFSHLPHLVPLSSTLGMIYRVQTWSYPLTMRVCLARTWNQRKQFQCQVHFHTSKKGLLGWRPTGILIHRGYKLYFFCKILMLVSLYILIPKSRIMNLKN